NPDGTQKWKFTTGANVFSSPAVGAHGTIYIGSRDEFYPRSHKPSVDHNVYALNPDGTQKWKFTTGAAVTSSPAVGGDGTIYIGSDDGNVYPLHPDGSQKWRFADGLQEVNSSPAVGADGTIYVGAYNGNVYAVNP